MDLKEALKSILPKLSLKTRKRGDEKWTIDRPVEFQECLCGQMVDQRIICVGISSEDDYLIRLFKTHATWCDVHNDPLVIEYCRKSRPCRTCYRWYVDPKQPRCYVCRSQPGLGIPPVYKEKDWFKEPKEKEEDAV
jgi:hypothetical protein